MIPILSNFSRCLTHAHALTLIICLFSREPDEKFRPLNIFHDFFVEFWNGTNWKIPLRVLTKTLKNTKVRLYTILYIYQKYTAAVQGCQAA